MSSDAPRLLVIEDEPDLRDGLVHNLELDGYRVDAVGDGDAGLERAAAGEYALVLLDLMLPGRSGLEVLRELRSRNSKTPVIIVSAKGLDRDKVAGLELGADDYVTKPFGLDELFARIRAVLRRTTPTDDEATDLFEFPKLTVDFKRFTVTRPGEDEQPEDHALSRYEAEILRVLVGRQGEVVTRDELLRKVWGYVHLPTTRTVDNHIARLRKKVERKPDDPRHVITVHGIGYRFEGGDA